MEKSRILGSALVVAGFAGWFVSADWRTAEASPEVTEAAEEETPRFAVVAERRTADTHILLSRYIGRLSARDTVSLQTEIAGTISSVSVIPGQTVSAGDLLFTIESDLLLGKIEQARSAVREAQDHFDSIRRLLEKQFASRSEYNQAKTDLDEARSDRDTLLDQLENSRIYAPVPGSLPLDMPKVGDFVPAGSNLIEMAVASDKKIRIQVPPSDAALFAKSKDKELAVTINGQKLEGTVRAISSIVNPSDSSVAIDVDVAGTSDMLSGSIARVEVKEAVDSAHLIGSNLVEIAPGGTSIVKALDGETVTTLILDQYRHSHKGLVVTGWPSEVTLITRGAGFVSEGESVSVRCEVGCD